MQFVVFPPFVHDLQKSDLRSVADLEAAGRKDGWDKLKLPELKALLKAKARIRSYDMRI